MVSYHYSRLPDAIECDELNQFVRFALITGLTKKATKRRRRSVTRDLKTRARMPVLTLPTGPASKAPLVLKLPHPSSHFLPVSAPRSHVTSATSTHTLEASPVESSEPANDNADTRDPPSWEHTTHVGKLMAANRALALHGAVCSFSLNLSQAEIDKALASPKGFASYFREAINRSMKRALGYKPKFWIAVDVTETGRLHLHGGMAVQHNEVHLAYDALSQAGGVWDNARHGDKQAHVDLQDDPDGWVRYAIRMRSKVRHIVGDRQTHAIANRLIGDARRVYEGWRRELANRS